MLSTFQVNDGPSRLIVDGDTVEDPECSNLTLDIICLQQVDEQVQPPTVPDGKMAALLGQVKVQ